MSDFGNFLNFMNENKHKVEIVNKNGGAAIKLLQQYFQSEGESRFEGFRITSQI